MKKIFRFISISGITTLLFSACSSSSFKSASTKIELEGNPTTGYSWQYELMDKSLVSVEEQVNYLGSDGVAGAPSQFVYTLTSLAPGSTSIKFEYKRPWENNPAEISKVYSVTVNKNGQIFLAEENKELTMFKSVSMEEGLSLIAKDSSCVILDVRRPDEYAAGHIPGALLLTNESMTEENTGALLPDKNINVYVYCRSGRRSKLASQKLVDFGYKNVVEFGGIIDYKGEIEK